MIDFYLVKSCKIKKMTRFTPQYPSPLILLLQSIKFKIKSPSIDSQCIDSRSGFTKLGLALVLSFYGLATIYFPLYNFLLPASI